MITQISMQLYIIQLFTVGSLRHLMYAMLRERSFLCRQVTFFLS